MLTVLGGLAEFERELIRTRTARGARACEGERGRSRSKTKAHQPSAQGGYRSSRSGRSTDGHRAILQRQPAHYQQAQRISPKLKSARLIKSKQAVVKI